MSALVRLHDRALIERWLRRDAPMHLYELGDLDDFFWPHTTWHALVEDDDIRATALLYTATDLPVLLLLGRDDVAVAARELLVALPLPDRFYAHVIPGLLDALPAFGRAPHGLYDRMVLGELDAVDTTAAVALGPPDLEEVLAFYRRAYPGNWFDPRMLATETYFGVRQNGELVCAGGVHVVSWEQRVAALGNIATAPSARRQGLARIVTAAVCKALRASGIELIGLNVASTNAAAIRVYRALGFERVAHYEEVMVTRAPRG